MHHKHRLTSRVSDLSQNKRLNTFLKDRAMTYYIIIVNKRLHKDKNFFSQNYAIIFSIYSECKKKLQQIIGVLCIPNKAYIAVILYLCVCVFICGVCLVFICSSSLLLLMLRESCPVSILHKSIAGRYRPVSCPDGPITARYRFIKNANWVCFMFVAFSGYLHLYFLQFIMKTYLFNFDPLKPHFYIVKLGFTGVYIIFFISAQKHRLWVLVRTASARRF